MGTSGRSYEHDDEPWGSTKVGEFLDYLLKKDSAPVSQSVSQSVSQLVGYVMSNAINS
jgi:hypothetical protein